MKAMMENPTKSNIHKQEKAEVKLKEAYGSEQISYNQR